MFIKRLKPNVFDVFVGDRWDTWTRVRRAGDRIVYVAGAFLNRTDLNQVKERLVRK